MEEKIIIKEGFVIQEEGGKFISFDVNGGHRWIDEIEHATLLPMAFDPERKGVQLSRELFGRADWRRVRHVFVKKEIKITEI